MTQGVIYTRVSSDEQVTGTSLAFQEQLCRKYCLDRGIDVVEVFREEGESAKTADRTELLRALEFCRKHKGRLRALVVAKVDRFARNTEDHFYVRKLLLDYGVTLHSVTEPIGNSPTEKFVETVLAASAEFDNAIRKQRCTDGMAARIAQGIWPYKPPLGYLCAHHKKRGEKKTQPDKPDPTVFPIIQRALKNYAAGTVRSQAELRTQLDAWGLAAHRGKPTSSQLVDRLLGTNLRFYAGVLVNPWTQEEHAGRHEAMITTEELHRIRLARFGRLDPVVVHRDQFNPRFPLRRTVRCTACGRSFTGGVSRGNGGTYPYYFCANRNCRLRGKGVRKEVLEPVFQYLLEEITPRDRFFHLLEESVRDLWRERQALFSETRLKREHRLAELEARRRRLFEMREDGTYTRELFQERLKEVETNIAALSVGTPESDLFAFNIDAGLQAARRFTRSATQHWFVLPPAVRPRFEHLVFPEGVRYDLREGVRTTVLGLLYALNRDSGGEESRTVDLSGISLNQVVAYLSETQQALRLLNGGLAPDHGRGTAA